MAVFFFHEKKLKPSNCLVSDQSHTGLLCHCFLTPNYKCSVLLKPGASILEQEHKEWKLITAGETAIVGSRKEASCLQDFLGIRILGVICLYFKYNTYSGPLQISTRVCVCVVLLL